VERGVFVDQLHLRGRILYFNEVLLVGDYPWINLDSLHSRERLSRWQYALLGQCWLRFK